MKHAWRTTAAGTTSVVAAETRGKAIAVTVRAANEFGLGVRFREVKAVRAPEYDPWAAHNKGVSCFNERYLPKRAGKGE